jgi:hypothetical protein
MLNFQYLSTFNLLYGTTVHVHACLQMVVPILARLCAQTGRGPLAAKNRLENRHLHLLQITCQYAEPLNRTTFGNRPAIATRILANDSKQNANEKSVKFRKTQGLGVEKKRLKPLKGVLSA